jgi:hypothetical protein
MSVISGKPIHLFWFPGEDLNQAEMLFQVGEVILVWQFPELLPFP